MTCRIIIGDAVEQLRSLPADSVDCCVTSPPYWGLRDYGVDGQLGMEPSLAEHIAAMVALFEEVRRVLKPTGTCWINYGDCYATTPNGRSAADVKATGNDDRTFRDKPFSTVGPILRAPSNVTGTCGTRDGSGRRGGGNAPARGSLKPKDLCMIPNRLAIALQDAGWWVRSEIIWGKPNAMPDSSGVARPGTAHEKIWLLTKTGDADLWRARDTGELSFAPDLSEMRPLATDASKMAKRWVRLGSYYDAAAVRMPAADASIARWSQDVAGQAGSTRANGGAKSNGPMKAVGGKRPDKQRGHSRRHDGFNGRWDAMTKAEQGENGRLLRNYEDDLSPVIPPIVWRIATAAFSDAHFATFPPALVAPCIMAGCPVGGTVLDPFGGAGTTGMVSEALGRDSVLIELNPAYAKMAKARIRRALGQIVDDLGDSCEDARMADAGPLFGEVGA